MLRPNDLVFERFLIVERLAFGAFSAVYRVLDQMANADLAFKVELPDEERQCTMIEHEYRIAHSVESRFLCQSFGVFKSGSLIGVSMELLGENLATVRRKRSNPPSISLLLNISIQALKGLLALHGNGIVHSDVKPSNLAVKIIDSDYDIVLFDYGLAEYEGEDPNVTAFRRSLKRNPRYMSLDTHNTGIWSERDDFVALLYTLSDSWKNELPWDGRTTAALVLPIKREVACTDLLPKELHVMADMLDQPDELVQRLEEVLGGCERDVCYELRYLTDAPDPNLKPKMVKYVFEEGPEKLFGNNHSA
jgi:serine/threonine protein kinase